MPRQKTESADHPHGDLFSPAEREEILAKARAAGFDVDAPGAAAFHLLCEARKREDRG